MQRRWNASPPVKPHGFGLTPQPSPGTLADALTLATPRRHALPPDAPDVFESATGARVAVLSDEAGVAVALAKGQDSSCSR
jgi:hypothetical protein